MRSKAPAVFPVFRSAAQAAVLSQLIVHSPRGDGLTVGELAERTGVPASTIYQELRRLRAADVVAVDGRPRARTFTANRAHPAYRGLADMVMATTGPHLVVAQEFAAIAGVDELLIFGSWAARYRGEAGAAPHDLDVLVVGDAVDRAAVYDAARATETRVGFPVNPTLMSSARWAGDDALVHSIKAGPTVEVNGATVPM